MTPEEFQKIKLYRSHFKKWSSNQIEAITQEETDAALELARIDINGMLIEEVERLREVLQLIFERWDDLGVNKDDDFGTVNEAIEEARRALGGGG